MKAKSRKRLLISSVAMLLVAMLALGTATFAWFTTSTTARADGLQVKTIKASELEISKATGDWGDYIDYGYENEILKPASTVNAANWFAANAAGKNASTANAETATELSSLTGYVFKDQLNIRNKGGADVDHVTISFSINETEANSGKYFRLALVPTTSKGTDVANSAFATGKSLSDYTYAAAVDTAAGVSGVTGAAGSKTITTATVSALSGTNASIDIGTLTGAVTSGGSTTYDAKYYNLYIWFEGQDTDCKDANAGNVIDEITFTVTGTTADQ